MHRHWTFFGNDVRFGSQALRVVVFGAIAFIVTALLSAMFGLAMRYVWPEASVLGAAIGFGLFATIFVARIFESLRLDLYITIVPRGAFIITSTLATFIGAFIISASVTNEAAGLLIFTFFAAISYWNSKRLDPVMDM